MPTCVLGLGSNLGDREATLRAALQDIEALPNVRVRRQSEWYHSRPCGGPAHQPEFLNAACVVETTIQPLAFLKNLQRIEERHGRERTDRWAPRTLDIDLLLYGDEVIEMPMLVVPHLRMTFRRFVLEPAAEIAPKLIHPIIGWTVERLLLHLNAARDEAVLVSPSEALRERLTQRLVSRFGLQKTDRPTFKTADQLWPPEYSTWLRIDSQHSGAQPPPTSGGLSYAAAAFPKLSILLDADGDSPRSAKAEWSAIVRQPGRGPTLRLQLADPAAMEPEVFAAFASVWADLGPASTPRLK